MTCFTPGCALYLWFNSSCLDRIRYHPREVYLLVDLESFHSLQLLTVFPSCYITVDTPQWHFRMKSSNYTPVILLLHFMLSFIFCAFPMFYIGNITWISKICILCVFGNLQSNKELPHVASVNLHLSYNVTLQPLHSVPWSQASKCFVFTWSC